MGDGIRSFTIPGFRKRPFRFIQYRHMNPAQSENEVKLTSRSDDPTQWLLSGQIDPSDQVRQFPISNAQFTIGRRVESSLCLPLACISKNHARIEWDEDRLILRDLNSTNGTFLNGTRVEDRAELSEGDLIQFANIVFRLSRQNLATESHTMHENSCDRALAMMQFDKLINEGGFVPFFQPIVRMEDASVIGYEILGRSRLFGLQSPVEMFTAASQLNLEAQLSEIFRHRGVEIGGALGSDINLFVNTHPKELGHEAFHKSLERLRENSNQVITLEIHEHAVTDRGLMRELCAVLKDLDIRLAFDDFGVGEARLVELGEFRPDYLKFDMEFTRNIDQASRKHQQVVTLFARLISDLGIQPLAEGIENEQSHQILKEMGFALGQGYYYGKPEAISNFLPKKEGPPAG